MSRQGPAIAGEYTIITTATTTQIVSAPASLVSVHIENVGTTATLDIYDAISGTTNKIFEWVTADGKVRVDLGIRAKSGIRVISGGTFGRAVIKWEK